MVHILKLFLRERVHVLRVMSPKKSTSLFTFFGINAASPTVQLSGKMCVMTKKKRQSRALSFSLKHKRVDLEIIRRWSFILPLKTLLALKWSHAHTKFSDYSVQ